MKTIESITPKERQKIVRTNLQKVFKEISSIKLVKKDEFNIKGKTTYWTFGFTIGESNMLQSACIDQDGRMEVRLHAIFIKL